MKSGLRISDCGLNYIRLIRQAAAFTALLVIAGAVCAAPNYDQSLFGVNYLKWEFLKQNPNFEKELHARAKIMKDAGIYWDRDGIGWYTVNPKPGVWDWEYTDKCMKAIKDEGINLVVILMGTRTNPPLDDTSRAAFAEYVYQTVNRYKDQIKVWEIWNEPNIPSFWEKPDVKAYTALVKEAYKAAKRADPTCTVIVGSTSGPGNDWFNGIHDNGGWDYCDGISIHPYAMAANPIQQGLDKELRVVKQLVNGYGKPKPIWSTEVGWKGKGGTEEESQASKIIQTYVIHVANGVHMDYFCMDNYDDWGFVKKTDPLETKLAYGSVKLLTQTLGSPGVTAPFEGYLKTPAETACYVFKKDGTKRALILWSNDWQTRTVQFTQKSGLKAVDIINRPVAIKSGKLFVGPTPIIVTGADSRQIGAVSMAFNPYLTKPGKNQIVNGELWAEKGKNPPAWTQGRFFRNDNKGAFETTDSGRNGSTCVSISKATSPCAWDASPIPVDPGGKYKLTAWIKTKDATGKNVVAMYWYSGNQWTCLGTPSTATITGTKDWTQVTVKGVAPRDAAFVRVNLISENNTGTTWFDDISLTQE